MNDEQRIDPAPPRKGRGMYPTALRRLASGRWPWRRLAWATILGAGLVQVLSRRFLVSPDALSYLDLADAWQALLVGEGGWGDAVNAYWSPFQSWWYALISGALRPAPHWESTVVHAGQWAVLFFCLRAFEMFWCQVLSGRCQVLSGDPDGEGGGMVSNPLPLAHAWALGYALFAATVLGWVTIWELTPDLWAATWLLLQGALLLRLLRLGIADGEQGRSGRAQVGKLALCLGFCIGLGYLTKAALLPMAVMGAGALFLLVPRRWTMGRCSWPALASACLLGLPWVLLLSTDLGRPTWGEAGRLNYGWYVNGAFGGGQHWQGEDWPEGSARKELGTALRPTRRLADDPPVFEFASPVSGTYPPWTDPVHWHEGLAPRFDLGRQLVVVGHHLGVYGGLARRHALALVAWMALLWLGRGVSGARVREVLFLALFALGILTMYALVHVELRFLGAPGIFLGGAAFMLLSRPEDDRRSLLGQRLKGGHTLLGITAIAVVGLAGPVVWDLGALVVRQRVAWVELWGTSAHGDAEAARALRAMGWDTALEDSLPVASIGFGMEAYWARLAGARVVAEVYRRDDQPVLARSDERFWALDPSERCRIFDLLGSAGARAVVTLRPPVKASREGWRRLGGSERWVLPLPPRDPQVGDEQGVHGGEPVP